MWTAESPREDLIIHVEGECHVLGSCIEAEGSIIINAGSFVSRGHTPFPELWTGDSVVEIRQQVNTGVIDFAGFFR